MALGLYSDCRDPEHRHRQSWQSSPLIPQSKTFSLSLSSSEGFLPELKFSRILTEPINPRARHRGRRPRTDVPKRLLSVSNVTSSGLSQSFFINGGLLSNMDSIVAMQNLQSAIPGIPISRIMAAGCPHGFSGQAREAGAPAVNSKNSLSMLPMMLQGITHPHGAAVPQHTIFSIGAMMPQTLTPPSSAHASSSSSSPPAGRATAQSSASASGSDSSFARAADAQSTASSHHSEGEGDRNPEVKECSDLLVAAEEAECAAVAAAVTSASRVHLSTAHLGAGSHVAFNPFLIPGMSHGLLYPHMFLPHGGIMALPAMPPGAVEAPPGNPKRRRNRGQEEWERKEEKAAGVEERQSASSSFSSPSTPSPKPSLCLTEELHARPAERRDCPSGLHQPGSGPAPGLDQAAGEEADQRSEDGREAVEKVKQDSEGRGGAAEEET